MADPAKAFSILLDAIDAAKTAATKVKKPLEVVKAPLDAGGTADTVNKGVQAALPEKAGYFDDVVKPASTPKYSAYFDPSSKDISRGIAAIGITGAAGGIAMAPSDAKAGEDPAELPENAEATAGKTPNAGYFDDVVNEKSDWAKPREHSSYFGRVLDIKKDTGDVFTEGVDQYKAGAKAAGEAFSTEERKKYNEYEDKYLAWEKGGMVGPPPVNDTGTGPAKALKGINDMVGGFTGAATSWIMGPLRSMISSPLEEHHVVKKELSEAVLNLTMPGIGVFKYGSATPKVTKVVKEVAETLNKIFNPETIGKGERAETLMRNALGIAARDTETTRSNFNDYFNTVNAMSPHDQAALIAYIEGRSGGAVLHDQSLAPVADTIRDAVKLRETKLKALPSTQQMTFVEDYYTHQWEDPNKAKQFLGQWFGKQGSGKNLKARSIPTIADGIAAGLKPLSMNPLETIMSYVTNMDRFIAHNAIIDAGRAVKDVKYYRNPMVAKKLGLVPLEGRLALRRTKYGDMQAYADPDWARVYNNAIGKGWKKWETAGSIYDGLQKASNATTALELGLSGYHLLTMIHEGTVASVATGISKAISGVGALTRGDLKAGAKLLAGGAKDIALSPAALAIKPILGSKLQKVYLGRSPGTAGMKQIADLLEAGGGRAVGRTHAQDYKLSAANTYFDAWKKGELAASFRADASKGPLKFFARQIGRTMQQFAQPLFDVYIPKMKAGAFYENMHAWLEANPAASYSQQVQMAKRIWDSVDNRFGEVVQDNIFWNTMLKQTAQLCMRSYSWNLGTIREIGGGVKGLATKPKSLGLKGMDYDPKTGYVVALPMVVGLVNAMYQYAMTGKMPESMTDLVAPRTGGQVPGLGGRGQVEERAQLPGYQKDVFGWYNDWYQEMLNKRSSLIATIGEVAANRDWKNDPIVNPEHSAPEWMKEYFEYVQKFLPISIKQGVQGEKKGSKLGLQSYLGIRPSPPQFTDPQGFANMKKSQGEQIDKKRKKAEERQKQIYGGPTE